MAKELGATKQEVHRNLVRLEHSGLISKDKEGRYTLTTFGRASCLQISTTLFLSQRLDYFEKHDFGDGRSRYEEVSNEHHDHLIDIQTGDVIEFQNEEIEALQKKIAKAHKMKLVGHRLELYGISLDKKK